MFQLCNVGIPRVFNSHLQTSANAYLAEILRVQRVKEDRAPDDVRIPAGIITLHNESVKWMKSSINYLQQADGRPLCLADWATCCMPTSPHIGTPAWVLNSSYPTSAVVLLEPLRRAPGFQRCVLSDSCSTSDDMEGLVE